MASASRPKLHQFTILAGTCVSGKQRAFMSILRPIRQRLDPNFYRRGSMLFPELYQKFNRLYYHAYHSFTLRLPDTSPQLVLSVFSHNGHELAPVNLHRLSTTGSSRTFMSCHCFGYFMSEQAFLPPWRSVVFRANLLSPGSETIFCGKKKS